MRALRILLIVLAAFFVSILLTNWNRMVSRAQTEHGTAPCCGPADETQQRELDFPYYSLRDGFDSKLLLVSVSPKPLDFVVAVRSRSGQTVLAPALTIQPQEKLTVDLRSFLVAQGADVLGDFSEGSVAVYFNGTIMPLAGQLTMTNPARKLTMESEMVDNTPGLGLLPKELNALWWGIGGGRDARFMVSNTSGERATADLFLDFLGERHASKPLVFAPHETKVLSITELLGELKFSPAQAPEGGITIVPRGPKPTLIAQGKITDPTAGYSTSLSFLDPSRQHARALHASGVPIGTPSADSPYAGTGMFVPHVIVRNLTGGSQNVTITLEYPVEPPPSPPTEEASAELSQQPVTHLATLVPVTLGPYQTADVALDDALGLLPLPLPYCSIRIDYSGPPGTVAGEVSSIESKGDLVVDSRLANEGDGWAGSGGHPWHLDEETESILFLTNMGEKEVPIGFQVQADGLHYYLTDLRLHPRETRAIDLRKLRDKQEADFRGHTIPSTATDGSVLWIRLEDVPVMGRLVVLQRNKGIASNYDCEVCQCPANLTYSLSISPSSAAIYPTNTQQFAATAWSVDCNQIYWPSTVTNYAHWFTYHPSIATVNDTTAKGRVTAVAIGNTWLKAEYGGCSYTPYCYMPPCYPPTCQCSPVLAWGTVPITVYDFTVSISPPTVAPLNAGTPNTTTVTVQTNPYVSGLQFTMQEVRIAGSGGHPTNHPTTLPAGTGGTFSPASGTTNGQGQFQSTYTARHFGGEYRLVATGPTVSKWGPWNLTASVGGLQQLVGGGELL
jgi:hypothetical protein